MLIGVFRTKPMECASALHQPDGVGCQGCHIGSLVELNGVSVALVAWSGNSPRVRALGGGFGWSRSRSSPSAMVLDRRCYEQRHEEVR